jgi:hypothetical protein
MAQGDSQGEVTCVALFENEFIVKSEKQRKIQRSIRCQKKAVLYAAFV